MTSLRGGMSRGARPLLEVARKLTASWTRSDFYVLPLEAWNVRAVKSHNWYGFIWGYMCFMDMRTKWYGSGQRRFESRSWDGWEMKTRSSLRITLPSRLPLFRACSWFAGMAWGCYLFKELWWRICCCIKFKGHVPDAARLLVWWSFRMSVTY